MLTVDAGGTRAASTRRRLPRDVAAGRRRYPRARTPTRPSRRRWRPRRRRRGLRRWRPAPTAKAAARRRFCRAARRGSRGNGGGERGVGVCGGGAQGASPSVRAPRAAARRHGARLAAELARQRAEAKAIEEGVRAVLRRREVLAGRIERGARRHEEARARLRALAELERELPHPLTRAEAAFRTTLRASEDDVPLLRAKLEELRRRAEAEAEGARGGGGSDEKKSRTGRAEPCFFSSSSAPRGLDPAVGANSGRRRRRPGETWRGSEQSSEPWGPSRGRASERRGQGVKPKGRREPKAKKEVRSLPAALLGWTLVVS